MTENPFQGVTTSTTAVENPFDLGEMLARLAALAHDCDPARPKEIQIGDRDRFLEFCVRAGVITKPEAPIVAGTFMGLPVIVSPLVPPTCAAIVGANGDVVRLINFEPEAKT